MRQGIGQIARDIVETNHGKSWAGLSEQTRAERVYAMTIAIRDAHAAGYHVSKVVQVADGEQDR